jgi:uncharacterized phage-associated protein
MVMEISCFDSAQYILSKKEKITAVKLQKLLYYCQAWSLVWDDAPLFSEHIEAWLNGPVIPILFYAHKGQYYIDKTTLPGSPELLSDSQKETIDEILNFYGKKSTKWLCDLSHLEDPWKIARKGLMAHERGNNEITHASMAEYYSSILTEEVEDEQKSF